MMKKHDENSIVIRCSRICKKYNKVPAVCGVDLCVREGTLLALLGPSGCGKTTVLRMLAGLEVPDFGEIEIGGEKVNSAQFHVPAEKRNIGMVFQEYALFPHMSVGKNIGYGLRKSPDRSQRVQEVLALVGLEGVRDRMPSELSGGQQQRVALARALAPKPSVILLDEPFSNLDAALRVRVRADVRTILREAQVTTIFVTHDQEEALSLADEIAVMMEGKIIQTDTPMHIYRYPAKHMIATFLGEANFLPGEAYGHEVRCALGSLKTVEPHTGEVEIMIRPEEVKLEKDMEGQGNIIDHEFFGHDQLIKVNLSSSTSIRSRTIGNNGDYKLGDRVSVRVEAPVICYPSKYGCPIGEL